MLDAFVNIVYDYLAIKIAAFSLIARAKPDWNVLPVKQWMAQITLGMIRD